MARILRRDIHQSVKDTLDKAHLDALIIVRNDLARMKDVAPSDLEFEDSPAFHMSYTCRNMYECGTVACIGGWTSLIAQKYADHVKHIEVDYAHRKIADEFVEHSSGRLRGLFYPSTDGFGRSVCSSDYGQITPSQCVHAIDTYLKTGRADWSAIGGAS